MIKTFLPLVLIASALITHAHTPAGQGHDHDHDHDHAPNVQFIQNGGQWHDAVLYRADVRGATVFLENGGITYSKLEEGAPQVMHDASQMSAAERDAIRFNGHTWKMRFIHPSPGVQLSTGTAAPYFHNYFLGNDRSRWASRVQLFDAVTYTDLWPGIDMVLRSDEGHLKYDLLVAANTDLSAIGFVYEGLDAIRIGSDGELVLSTSVGEVIEMSPHVFYGDGMQETISCRYELDGNVLRFAFPEGYDARRKLVIDPTLVASTMSGSTTTAYGHCAAFDNDGNIYTGAIAFGQGYNTTVGAFQTVFGGGNTDIAISKYDPTGAQLLYATYIGGSGGEYPHSLIVDASFSIWVLGTTNSTNYPVSANAFDPTFNGSTDIVVSRLSADGQTMEGSTYFGGSGSDGTNSLTTNYGDNYRGEIYVDAENNAYVATCTHSTDLPIPEGALQMQSGGGQDGLLFSLDPTLSTLRWATYFGGSQGDMAFGIRLKADGTVAVAGGTASNDLPTTPGTVHPTSNGENDAFVALIGDDGSTLVASTYWGSNVADHAFFLDLDSNENIYIYGQTSGFIPIQPAGTYGTAGKDIFVAKLSADLTATEMSTVMGNDAGMFGYTMSPIAFMVDQCSRVYISGHGGLSGIINMPTTPDNFQTSGGFYVAAFDEEMTDILFGTYFGSTMDHVDGGTSRFDPRGVIYQGVCTSGPFPTTPWAYSNSSGGGWDIAVFKIDMEQSGVNVGIQTATTQGCVPASFTLNATGNAPLNIWDPSDGTQTSGPTITLTYDEVGVYTIYLIGIDSTTCNISDTTMITITVGDADDPVAAFEADPISSCTGYGAQFTIIGTPTSSVSWDFGDGGSSSQTAPMHPYAAPGTYEVWLTVTDDVCGGIDSVMVEVVVPPATLEYDLASPVYICDGGTIILDAGGGFNTYAWSEGSTAQMISVSEPGEYSVTVTEGFCTGSAVIDVFPAPGVPRLDDVDGCPGLETILEIPFAATNVTWSTGEDSTAIAVTETGIYWYEAIDPYGCTIHDTVEVRVIPIEDALATIPNVFTPNNDGYNDRFEVTGLGLQEFQMEVFNRWGQLVFSSSNQANGWNGGQNNSTDRVTEGTYFYVITFRDICSQEPLTTHTGHVTLLR